MVSLTFASWNQIAAWAIEISERMALMYAQKSSACAVALLRRVSRKPHVLVGKNRKKERL